MRNDDGEYQTVTTIPEPVFATSTWIIPRWIPHVRLIREGEDKRVESVSLSSVTAESSRFGSGSNTFASLTTTAAISFYPNLYFIQK